MNYDEIMKKITSGLTGQTEHDVEYLYEQGEQYKTHKLSKEILRGIGRLIYEVLPPDKRNRVSNVINNDNLGVEAALDEAEFQINKKNYVRATEILESIINKMESDDGERLMYKEDSVSEYHCFRNPFEQALYCELFKPQKAVRRIPQAFDHVYYMYGTLLFEVQKYDEAKSALIKAVKLNPINTDALFELSEIYKLDRDWDDYIDSTKHCLKVAYTGEGLSRCYRNLGFYYIEMEDYDLAAALYYFSMRFGHKSTMAQSQLFYIQQKTGEQAPLPSLDSLEDIFAENDIQFGPDNIVVSLATSIGKQAEENRTYSIARYLYTILYDITLNDEIIEWLENLPQDE